MPAKAKSIEQKRIDLKQLTDQYMARAVAAYRAELDKPLTQRKGLRKVCADFQDMCFKDTGTVIKLSHSRLNNIIDGGLSREAANASRAWLTPEEKEIVLGFSDEMAARGWPLSHRRIKEHVDLLVRARLGSKFPNSGVGKNWTHRFIENNSDRIKMTNSRSLEDKRGRAANPETNAEYWRILEETIKKYNITPETTYGTDEIGIQSRGQESERVATSKNHKGPQYQQRGGSRENTTVLVTICADGTSIPPTIIFKGSAFQCSWAEKNPLNASIGYQKKGWTDGEIGAEWIKLFDKETRHKVKEGEYRLLLVDGHNSHYTVDFLLYAREHNIIVLCYPSHTTHIYQGLDVIIFSPLKTYLGQERDKWFRERGQAMDKTNFCEIYGKAHVRALTKQTIQSAFKATGVWPFNPDVVTEQMLAPSKVTSLAAHLPVQVADPSNGAVEVLATMIRDLAVISDQKDGCAIPAADNSSDADNEADQPASPNTRKRQAVINKAVSRLSSTKLAHLFNTRQTTHHDPMPATTHTTIPAQISPLLNLQPETEREIVMFAAFREMQAENEALRSRNITLQAGNILNEVYCANTRAQLQAQDDKKRKKKAGVLTGQPRVLSGDAFYEERKEFEKQKRTEVREKAERDSARVAYRAAKLAWDCEEQERKEIKQKETEKYKRAVKAWETAKAKAATSKNGRRGAVAAAFKAPKPKMGPVPKQKPQPKLKDFMASNDSSSDGSASNEDEDDGDEDEDDN